MLIERRVLLEIINNVKKAVNKSEIATENMFKLALKDQFFSLAATSSLLTIISELEVDNVENEEFECVVNSDFFYESISRMYSDEVNIQYSNNILNLSSSMIKLNIPTYNLEQFNIICMENEESIKLQGKNLQNYVLACEHSLGNGKNDFKLGSYNLEFGDGISVTTLDRHRISIRRNIQGDTKDSIIIHGKQLKSIISIITTNLAVEIPESKQYVKLTGYGDDNEMYTIFVTAVNGPFFNLSFMKNVLHDFKIHAIANKYELLNAFSVVSIVGNPTITFTENSINLFCEQNVGTNVDISVPAQVTGDIKDYHICINGTYAIDSLRSLKGDKAKLNFNNDASPVIIFSERDEMEIILPIKK